MIIPKAIELLERFTSLGTHIPGRDTFDSIKLGTEALKRIDDVRKHPAHSIYGPLPGESMPERGIR